MLVGSLCDFVYFPSANPRTHSPMASSHRFSALTLFLCFSFSLIISPSRSLTCSSQTFPNNKRYERCTDLSQLSSYLHWTYDASKSTLSIAFIAPSAKPNGWISWALNPTGTGMAGAQALVAFRQPNGGMTVRTYNISSYTSIVPSKLSYDVTEMNADSSGGMMRIFATVVLPEENKATVNQVWQVGPAVVDGFPAKHDFQRPNLNSKGTFDFLSGKTNSGAGNNIIKKRSIHGILNAVSWGFLFPLGIIVARYIKTFEFANPAWFYLHVSCQCSAYILGVAGWGTGLKLGSDSTAITYTYHRNIGIALFALATIQVFALFLRPSKEHKYRLYWNIYHHSIGYAVLILGILNVFKGLAILGPGKAWKTAYFIVIIVLGVIAVLLEALTWIIVLKRKSNKSTKL